MNEKNWLEYFLQSEEPLFLDLEAIKVYDDIAREISESENNTDFQENRNVFYQKLEERLDNSTDDFARLIISYSFVKGIYFIQSGLSTQGKMNEYRGKTGKRFQEFSQIVVNSSMKLCNSLIENQKQYRLCQKLIELALQCSYKKFDNQIENNISNWVQSIRLDVNNEYLAVFQFEFLVPAISYLLASKNFKEKESLLSKINDLLEFSKNQGDTTKSVRSQYNAMNFDCIFPFAFDLKIKYYRKLNDREKEKQTILDFGQFYETLGFARIETGESNDLMVAEFHFENAVGIFSENGFQAELKRAKQKLDEIKNRLDELQTGILHEFAPNLRNYMNDDEKNTFENMMKEFNSLDFNNKIHYLINLVHFVTRDDVENFMKQRREQNPLSEVFSTKITNSHSQTTFQDDSENSKENYALFNCLYFNIIALAPFIDSIISEVTEVKNAKLDFSISGYPLALQPRQNTLNKAFELFFSGDVYNALHLLTPQIEYWFREEVYSKGGQTSNLKFFPTEQAKTLTPIFETEELKDFLGEEKHWLFEKLMNQEPMNLRNKIAHGLELNDNGYSVYFVLAVIKLLMENTESAV